MARTKTRARVDGDGVLLTRVEVARLLRTTVQHIRALQRDDNPIPFFRAGRKYLFSHADVMCWLRERTDVVDADRGRYTPGRGA